MKKWMKKCVMHPLSRNPFIQKSFHPIIPLSNNPSKRGFTLIEVILVLVVIVIISGISLPHLAGSYRNNKLRTSARSIRHSARYARTMAISRNETMYVVLNHEKMKLFVGAEQGPNPANEADGELDQSALKNLGYIDGDKESSSNGNIDPESQITLPEHLTIKTFDKNWQLDEKEFDDVYRIPFYPNGQCDWFELEIEDKRGTVIHIEIDPISGKVFSEFVQ